MPPLSFIKPTTHEGNISQPVERNSLTALVSRALVVLLDTNIYGLHTVEVPAITGNFGAMSQQSNP